MTRLAWAIFAVLLLAAVVAVYVLAPNNLGAH